MQVKQVAGEAREFPYLKKYIAKHIGDLTFLLHPFKGLLLFEN